MSSNGNTSTAPEENWVFTQTALYIAAFLISLALFVISACVRFRKHVSTERTETQFVAVGGVLSLYSLFSCFHWVELFDSTAPAGCITVGFFTQYGLLSLLVATTCIGVHLLLLLYPPKFLRVIEEQKRQRYKYLEILYIILIIFIPLVFLPWPLINNLYGKVGHLCWIIGKNHSNDNSIGFIEQIVLYYFWSFLVFGFTIVVTISIMFTICRHTARKGNANIYTLLGYMIIFLVVNAIGVAIRVCNWMECCSVQKHHLEHVQSIMFPLRTGLIAAVLLIRVCYIYRNKTKSEQYKRLVDL